MDSTCFNLTISVVGMPELTPSSWAMYPNPTEGRFTLELDPVVEQAQLTIVNAIGKMVYKQQLTNTRIVMDVEHLSSGIYIVTIQTKLGKRVRELIIR